MQINHGIPRHVRSAATVSLEKCSFLDKILGDVALVISTTYNTGTPQEDQWQLD
jgi:hypothetical protein